jgi:L-ascorbate metabolism protein UlaG (beta-lactamase superfamily)
LQYIERMRETLHITYVGHATCLVEMDGVRVLTDPVLRNRVGYIRRQTSGIDRRTLDDIDAVLISHAHHDHLDFPSLRKLGRDVRLIVPEGSGDMVARRGFENVVELKPGDRTRVDTIDIEATLATHGGMRHPFGPVAETLGFVMHGSQAVYFAGDTDIFPEMDTIHDALDVALLPVWGWGPTLGDGHMTPRRAAESLTMLRPHTAIPIHWGTFAPLGMGWLRPRFLTDPPYRFVEHASDLAPDVNVHVVHPGNRFRFVN